MMTEERYKYLDEGDDGAGGKPRRMGLFSIILGPVLGLLYVVLLPFIAIVSALVLAGLKILSGITALLHKSLDFGWRPGTAYLAGKKKKRKEDRENR